MFKKNLLVRCGILVAAVFLFFSVFPLQKTSGQTDAPLVFLAEVEDEIKAGTLQYLKRAVREAKKSQAD